MNRRSAEKEAKRARIYRASKRLFSERGFSGTTIGQIAHAADVGTGTVFLYARDKGALLAQVFCGEVARVQEAALAKMDAKLSFERKLSVLFSAFFDYYDEDQELARVFLKELLFSSRQSPEIAAATHTFVGVIADLAAEAVARGALRADVNPFQLAAVLFGVYWTSVTAWLGGALPSKRVALSHLASAIELVMQGAAPQRPRRA